MLEHLDLRPKADLRIAMAIDAAHSPCGVIGEAPWLRGSLKIGLAEAAEGSGGVAGAYGRGWEGSGCSMIGEVGGLGGSGIAIFSVILSLGGSGTAIFGDPRPVRASRVRRDRRSWILRGVVNRYF
jgi:hypothetical protein